MVEVHDFKPGDELHIFEEDRHWWSDIEGYTRTTENIFQYFGRDNYQDSIVYHYTLTQSITQKKQDNTTFTFSVDTLSTTIRQHTTFNKLPSEPTISEYKISIYYMNNTSPLVKIDPRDTEFFSLEDSCWLLLHADGCMANYVYKKGLGGPYYACTNTFSFGGSERKLVYYKKGNTSWGTPLLVTGVSDVKTANKLEVFPNPADDIIYITSNESNIKQGVFKLFDGMGRTIKTEYFSGVNSKINLSGVPAGVYFYEVRDNKEVLRTDKLIIR